jgi:hypothetical protein
MMCYAWLERNGSYRRILQYLTNNRSQVYRICSSLGLNTLLACIPLRVSTLGMRLVYSQCKIVGYAATMEASFVLEYGLLQHFFYEANKTKETFAC